MTDDDTLDIDPGPTIDVETRWLTTADDPSGFIVIGTDDEALARRLIEQKIIREETDTIWRERYLTALRDAIATYSESWYWGDRDDDDNEPLLRDPTDTEQETFRGILFDLDLEEWL